MVGTILFNVLFGIVGFIIVFLLSFSANTLTTAFVRSTISFAFFFLSGYLFRWMFTYIQKDLTGTAPILSHNMSENELKQLMEGLTEEEAQKVAAYIRHMLQNEEES
ncbi:hypothetical protein [Anoxybacteroides tepidamans]|uniref:hypothetical protein n=1 Tax=Anoxybacteroides tepidamans TaxID=265948 RepID=UPI000488DCDC|nr:hypothetical protein [Anoxybacillus tepidamans]